MFWNASLETGIPKIDEQHKELFRQADILLDRNQSDRVPTTLNFLGSYVVKHFSDEQVMQASSKYPKAAAHKQLHDKFINVYKDLRKKYDSGSDKHIVVMEINKAVMNWLRQHIMVHDKEFAEYYKSLKK